MNRPSISTVMTTTTVYEIRVFLFGHDTFFSSTQTSLKKMRVFATIFLQIFARSNFLDGLDTGFCSTFSTLLIFLFLGFFFILFRKKMAGLEGLEPPTTGFGDRRSTNWSYSPTRYAYSMPLSGLFMYRVPPAPFAIFIYLQPIRIISLILLRRIVPPFALLTCQRYYDSLFFSHLIPQAAFLKRQR